MTKYIEYFQVEAKCLLKDFKKNLPEAKSRCEKYFNGRDSLSLMNTQHVIAKEYGFDSWNDLISKEPHKLAEALIIAKNKTFNSPFTLWHGGRITTGYEENKYKLHDPKDYQLKYDSKKKTFISDRGEYEYMSFEHLDVSDYDLSGIDPLKVRYSEDTKWPEDPTKLPLGFKPKEFLESRKNPGLGIKNLHKLGIKGQGRNIAIIDWAGLFNHIEYQNNLKGYEEIGEEFLRGKSSERLSSIIGKTCGLAPNACAYYYAVDLLRTQENPNGSNINFAKAIKKVCELHKNLIAEGKNGIDVIHLERYFTSEGVQNIEGYEETLNAIKEAEDLGIWCYWGDISFTTKNKIGLGCIYCKLDGNVENPDDYILYSEWKIYKVDHPNTLCFPCGAKTVSLEVKMDEYVFEHYSNRYAITYISGLYLLAKSVKESITPYEFFELGLKTGDFRKGIGTIVNPVRLIESLK